MKILAVNAGSSSLKFKLYEMPQEDVLIYGYIEKIGEDSCWKIIKDGEVFNYSGRLEDHLSAVKVLISSLFSFKVISSLDEIGAICHRIVNGAGKYLPTLLDSDEIKRLEEIMPLSKAHMEGQLSGIKAFKEEAHDVLQYALFDTAFHHTILEENYIYPIPYEWYLKYGIRKFGFHGLSCQYITSYMEKILGKKPNLIICHIGNGASITAVSDGVSINNTMGFTANCGLVMGNRSGTIDYSFLPYLSKVSSLSLDEIDDILNKESGLDGIYKGGADNRNLEKGILAGDPKAILANKIYVNSVSSNIAKYYLQLSSIDAIVLCGGVGENAIGFRASLINRLNKLGIFLDESANKQISKFGKTNSGVISSSDSLIKVYVVPTDEEVVMALETYNLLK